MSLRTTAAVMASAAAMSFAAVSPALAIEETSPAWNCLTMGNHQCGPAYKPLTKREQRFLVKDFHVPANAARHAVNRWFQPENDYDVWQIVVPAYPNHKEGRVIYL